MKHTPLNRRTQHHHPIHRVIGLCLLSLCLAACTPAPITDPVATALDPMRSVSRRVAAIELTTTAQSRELWPLIFSQRHPTKVREAAADQLIAIDADTFWHTLDRRMIQIDDWPMITWLCAQAADDQRTDFIPAAIRSWARPTTLYADKDRPEYHALDALRPTTDVDVLLWKVFGASNQALIESGLGTPSSSVFSSATRIPAWTILSRLHDDAVLREGLKQSPQTTTLMRDLKLAAQHLDVLPSDRESILWLTDLAQHHPDLFRLTDDYQAHAPTGIALRHLPALARLNDMPADHCTHQSLLGTFRDRLTSSSTYRTPLYVARGEYAHDDQIIKPTSESLADHADELTWADLVVLHMMLDALDEPKLISGIFTQAQADQADTATEHGGVITWNDTHLGYAHRYSVSPYVAIAFPPARRTHDHIYYASNDCIKAMYTSLAHYHLHAQDHDNAAWAGPGLGDLGFANRLHANCLVFTFIDAHTLNVDAYFPGDIIIDLGCIQRP